MLTLGALLVLAALATACVALWLFWVCATVLPALGAKRIPMWLTVAACFLAFSGLSWICVGTGGRNAPLRWSLGLTSAVAVGLGTWAVINMIQRLNAGEDFEGYIILMGMAVTGHGVLGLLYTLLARRPAVPPHTV
jgi:hypothetical protein